MLIGQKWQKCFYFRQISKILLIVFKCYSLTFLPQVLNTFSYYYITVALKNLWFDSLDWLEFFHQCLHRQFSFLSKLGLFLSSIVICSICYFCAILMENIAVRLRSVLCLQLHQNLTNQTCTKDYSDSHKTSFFHLVFHSVAFPLIDKSLRLMPQFYLGEAIFHCYSLFQL